MLVHGKRQHGIPSGPPLSRTVTFCVLLILFNGPGCDKEKPPRIPALPVRLGSLDPLAIDHDDTNQLSHILSKFSPPGEHEGPVDATDAHLLRLFVCDPAWTDRSHIIANFLGEGYRDLPPGPGNPLFYGGRGLIGYKQLVPGPSADKPPSTPGEAHVGQYLAMLGEVGVEPSREIPLGTTLYRVRDLVADTADRFSFDQEIEWRVVALAYYQPHIQNWRTRFGKELTWAQITRELLQRIRDGQVITRSCFGTHLLYTLATLYRVDKRVKLWDSSLRRDVEACLQTTSKTLEASQRSDGSWDSSWLKGTSSEPTPLPLLERILVTGHLLEYLAILPKGLRPPDPVVSRAGHYLLNELDKLDQKILNRFICHSSHGVRAYYLTGPRTARQRVQGAF